MSRPKGGEMNPVEELATVIERYCACGYRGETPETHPHVIGCPTELALMKARRWLQQAGTHCHGCNGTCRAYEPCPGLVAPERTEPGRDNSTLTYSTCAHGYVGCPMCHGRMGHITTGEAGEKP